MKKYFSLYLTLLITGLLISGLIIGCGGGGSSSSSGGSSGTVEGTITNSQTGNPVQGAIVNIDGVKTTSNSEGQYSISGLNAGSGKYVAVTAKAYSNYKGSVDVTAGITVTHNVKMDQTSWQKSYGGSDQDKAFSGCETSDGGFIFAGGSFSTDGDVEGNHGGRDAWLVKTDKFGEIEWKKCYGGTGSEAAFSIIQTSDGGYIFTGYSGSNDGDVSGNHGEYDLWIVKIDSTGTIQWQKCYGGTSSEMGNFITASSDGGYAVAGYSESKDGDLTENKGSEDYWIIKIDSEGNLLWQRSYGGGSPDIANSIRLTSDGGYFVTGNTRSDNGDVVGFINTSDYWILKLDSSGYIQWQKCIGSEGVDYCYDGRQLDDGSYIAVGHITYGGGNITVGSKLHCALLVKMDSSGEFEWMKSIGEDEHYQFPHSIVTTSDNGFVFTGYRDADVWLVKIDSNQEVAWEKTFEGSDSCQGFNLLRMSNDDLLITGWSEGMEGSHGDKDFMVIKTDPDGNLYPD